MRTYERDFHYLLDHLVPGHRLAPALRRDVRSALRSGDDERVRRVGVRVLESLCETRWLERERVESHAGDVDVVYRRPGGFRVRVTLPRAAWEAATGRVPGDGAGGREAGDPPADASPGGPPATRHADAEAGASAGGMDAGSARVLADAGDLLPEIVRAYAVSDRADPLLRRVDRLLGTVEKGFGVAAARLDLVEEAAALDGAPAQRIRRVRASELRAIPGAREAIETGSQAIVPRADVDDDALPPGAFVGVAAVFSLGQVQGVLRLVFPPGVDAGRMKRALSAATALVRQAFELHQQVANLTSVDALTGAYNRHFFDVQLPVETERAMRSGSPVSLLVIDIDDFKRVNDELGHRRGDDALRTVAELIRRNLRKVDLAFRYGGEEFVVLLPGTPELEAVHTAERLRRVIESRGGVRDAHGRVRPVTVSVGVSVFPQPAHSPEQLFQQADAAMYRAKRAGKNRVERYVPPEA